jgi:hypothetical protein
VVAGERDAQGATTTIACAPGSAPTRSRGRYYRAEPTS